MAKQPRWTSVEELLKIYFEQFGTFGTGRNSLARSERVDWDTRFGRGSVTDARFGRGLVGTTGGGHATKVTLCGTL